MIEALKKLASEFTNKQSIQTDAWLDLCKRCATGVKRDQPSLAELNACGSHLNLEPKKLIEAFAEDVALLEEITEAKQRANRLKKEIKQLNPLRLEASLKEAREALRKLEQQRKKLSGSYHYMASVESSAEKLKTRSARLFPNSQVDAGGNLLSEQTPAPDAPDFSNGAAFILGAD